MIGGMIVRATLAAWLIGTNCGVDQSSAPIEGGEAQVKYFAGIAGLSHPFTLDHELTEIEARRAGKYFRGTFDKGRLVRIERFIDDRRRFVYEYSYHPGGKIAQAILRSEGQEPRILRYDERGKLLEDGSHD